MPQSVPGGSALLRKSLADVTRRKGRTVLVVLGILIGVFGLTSINVANDSLYSAFAYSQNETAAPNLDFTVDHFDPALSATLAQQPNVAIVQARTIYRTRWQIAAAPGHINLSIIALPNLQRIALDPFQLTSGRYPNAGEIVLESSDSGLQSFALGNLITVATSQGPQQLKVVGTVRTLGQNSATFAGRALGYMSTDALQHLTGITTANDLQIKLTDPQQAGAAAQQIASVLHAHQVTIIDASVITNEFDPTSLAGLFVILRVLAIIALLLTCFLIINTVTTLVAEQTKIIGTMKALGGTRGTIARSYLTSVVIYSAVGTILGIGLGLLGGYGFTNFMTSVITLDLGPFHVTPAAIIISAVVGLGVPLLAAMIPLWQGTGITVRDALAGYGMTTSRRGKRGILAKLPVSQTTLLGLRGIFRKRGRAVLTLLALTFSGTAFLAIQTTTYSVDHFIGQVFATYNFDVDVGMNPQPYAQVRAQLAQVPNVARIERLEQTEVKTHWGQVLLTGAEHDTQLYHYDVIQGSWADATQPNTVFISDVLAKKSGLKPGDTLTFSSATKTVSWHIIGVVHDLNGGLGVAGVALTTVENVHAFEDVPADLASNFMIGASDRSQGAVDQLATALDNTLSQAGMNPSVSTAHDQIKRNQTQFQILYVILDAVAGIVGLVGLLGLFNTLTTSVLERRREIGILRSMGATGMRVARIFWIEGLALAGIAWLCAVALGLPAAYGFVTLIQNVFLPIPFAFSPLNLLWMLVAIGIIATLASIGPALSASRVKIADTLRYE